VEPKSVPNDVIDSSHLQTTLHRKHLSLTAAQPEDVLIYGDVAGKHLCGVCYWGNLEHAAPEVDQRADRFFDTHSTQLLLVSQLDRRARILLACSAHRQ
jgi:hypothetical protein